MNNVLKSNAPSQMPTKGLIHTWENYNIWKDKYKSKDCLESGYVKQEFSQKRR